MPVPLDAFTVTFLARDIDRLARGREIRSVGIATDRVLIVDLADQLGLKFLYDSGFPLLFVDERLKGRATYERTPRFDDPLAGSTILKIEQVGLERVIRMAAERRDNRRFNLYFEITPPLPNLFLTDAEDIVLAVLVRAGTQTKKRAVNQGERYSPPAAHDKMNPFDVTAEEFEAVPWQHDDEALSRCVSGLGPFMSKEMTFRARRYGSLVRAFREAMEAYRGRQIAPTLFHASHALTKKPPLMGVAWYKPLMDGVSEVRPMPSVNAAAAAAFHAFLRATSLDRRQSALINAIAKDTAKWTAIVSDANRAVKGKDAVKELRKLGERILANLGRIKKGAAEARLPDIYSETVRDVVVTLDKRLSPHANAEAYFKKARKAERSALLAEEMIRKADQHLKHLAALRKEAEGPDVTQARLRDLEARMGRRAAPRRERPEEVDDRAAALGIRPRTYVVTGGWTVLVGRTAAENDVLTHKYASPSDLWFHARQAQGSHVVLRRDKKKVEPSREAIIEAARLAAYFSKAKTSKHVPVSYTEKRYVKKVRRGAPGLAAMLREKVVFVTPAPPKETQTV